MRTLYYEQCCLWCMQCPDIPIMTEEEKKKAKLKSPHPAFKTPVKTRFKRSKEARPDSLALPALTSLLVLQGLQILQGWLMLHS